MEQVSNTLLWQLPTELQFRIYFYCEDKALLNARHVNKSTFQVVASLGFAFFRDRLPKSFTKDEIHKIPRTVVSILTFTVPVTHEPATAYTSQELFRVVCLGLMSLDLSPSQDNPLTPQVLSELALLPGSPIQDLRVVCHEGMLESIRSIKTSLKTLHLWSFSKKDRTEVLKEIFTKNPSISNLSLEGLTIDDAVLEKVCKLPLKALTIKGCRGVTDNGLSSLKYLTQLEYFQLVLRKPATVEVLGGISKMANLKDLCLSNYFGEMIDLIDILKNSTQLTHLKLPNIRVSDRGMQALLRSFRHLQYLVFCDYLNRGVFTRAAFAGISLAHLKVFRVPFDCDEQILEELKTQYPTVKFSRG